ncbi:dihydroorotase [Nisaea sp.]|uniref:dihydroorotase n=1 Tax=Nisaea sp. TaxID=2024842 RepID=UPI002B278CBE|nr:dihydroorotase [Nisaea sp.]
MSSYDLIIKNGTVATPGAIEAMDIGVKDGKIAGLGSFDAGSAAEVFDASGLHVLPGVIDTQVHFREPGAEHKEDIAHGTMAAAMGGVTAIFEMPNTNPLTLTPETHADKIARASAGGWVDFAFFVGGSAENVGKLHEYENLPGCPGIKIFMGSSTGSLLAKDDETLAKILADGRRRFAVHAEDEYRLEERKHIAEKEGHPRVHNIWRDEETAVLATNRILKLARDAGRPVHILHVTTAEEMDILAANKDIATVEVTPNHLTLAAPDCYEELGSLAQMNPPVREKHHQDALWRAIEQGVVDVIGSDHAPHTLEEKAKPYPQTPSGMTGVQTLLVNMLNHMNEGRLSLRRLVELTSAGPQRVYNIACKGRIAKGYDADFAIVDLKAKRTITNDWIASKCGWTPYDGKKVTGWVMATLVRGNIVMREDELVGKATGAPVKFVETL